MFTEYNVTAKGSVPSLIEFLVVHKNSVWRKDRAPNLITPGLFEMSPT